MPLVLEEDVRVANGFDPASAATLYWKDVPVLVRQHDREDQTEQLTFRILSGVTRQNHSLRVLRIHISSEDDLYFLHTLEVTEDEFQCLKADQSILVDFASFPGKLIGLLERCISSQASDMPRFQAVLSIRPGDSVLKVVETNDFKQLAHITLAFRPGTDYTVKQFLAFRLAEVKTDSSKVQAQLAGSQADYASSQEQLHDCQLQLSKLHEKHQRQTLELEAQLREQAAAAQQDKLQQVAAVKDQLEREIEEAGRRSSQQQDLLNKRIAELDSEGRQLRDQKYQLDTQVSELSHKLGTAEGNSRSLEQELAQLRSQHKQAAADKHSTDMQLADTKASLLALQEKCAAQTQLVAQQQARLSDLEAAVKQWESRCADLRELLAGHEARCKEAAAEVMKGNDAIEKQQTEIRLLKEKLKRTKAILVRQEEEAAAKDSQLAATQRELAGLGHSNDGLSQELSMLKSENAELKAKLEESRQQLQSNEQMIRWLNQQVTDAQLQVSAVPGTRYKFRPSQLAGTASAVAATSPGVSTGTYGAGLRAASPTMGSAMGSAMGKLATATATAVKQPHINLSSAFSPHTVTPRQDYALPQAVMSASKR